MNFIGPAVVYTQTRSLSSFLGFITNHVKRHIKTRGGSHIRKSRGGSRSRSRKIRRKRK